MKLRVVAYNIKSCQLGLDAVAAVLRELDPDVACLQEVYDTQTEELAAALGRTGVHGPAFRRYGNALLLRAEPAATDVVRFPPGPGREPRGMVVASLDGGPTVASVHLGLSASERRRQVEEVLGALAGREPFVLAGDLNEQPGGPAVARLCETLTDAFAAAGEGDSLTFPAGVPARRIDYVLCSPGLRAVRVRVPPAEASDHRAVVADLER